MSCFAHQHAIDADAPAAEFRRSIRQITSRRCPFCGEKELYAYPPDGSPCLLGKRTWWLVGCQSRRCDSSWRLERDSLGSVFSLLSHSQPNTHCRVCDREVFGGEEAVCPDCGQLLTS